MKKQDYAEGMKKFVAIDWVDFDAAAAAFMDLTGNCNVPPAAALKRVESEYAQRIPQEVK